MFRTPVHADFMISHSTVAGYVSWRNKEKGSWFLQVMRVQSSRYLKRPNFKTLKEHRN
jgi:caspase-like apoptosis-related cysteine protease